jgi:hypothetical protein
MHKRFFTVKEANELIPFLTERLRQISSACRELKNTWAKVAPELQEVIASGGMLVDLNHFHLLCRLQSLASEIGSQGCHIKDLESGLIDFPTLWEGREVYLCWKKGEPEVGFWHEVDAGFAGRQPLRITPEPEPPSSKKTKD